MSVLPKGPEPIVQDGICGAPALLHGPVEDAAGTTARPAGEAVEAAFAPSVHAELLCAQQGVCPIAGDDIFPVLPQGAVEWKTPLLILSPGW